MICQLKSKTYHDEIVAMVAKGKLSTHQIKTLTINDLEDINKERHRLAIENGYSRQSSAYFNFKHWIERGKMFLMMDKEYLPNTKLKDIQEELKLLNLKIQRYINEK